ncbi:MAG: hypothetical protein IPK33_33265 [Gemmatimonadetes bacterium]|nr:hypothetical protein [Gemmatimonadota bacterium]
MAKLGKKTLYGWSKSFPTESPAACADAVVPKAPRWQSSSWYGGTAETARYWMSSAPIRTVCSELLAVSEKKVGALTSMVRAVASMARTSADVPVTLSLGSGTGVTYGSLVLMKLVSVCTPKWSPSARAFSTAALSPARPLGNCAESTMKCPQLLNGPSW